jgi:hypothetical protein
MSEAISGIEDGDKERANYSCDSLMASFECCQLWLCEVEEGMALTKTGLG